MTRRVGVRQGSWLRAGHDLMRICSHMPPQPPPPMPQLPSRKGNAARVTHSKGCRGHQGGGPMEAMTGRRACSPGTLTCSGELDTAQPPAHGQENRGQLRWPQTSLTGTRIKPSGMRFYQLTASETSAKIHSFCTPAMML